MDPNDNPIFMHPSTPQPKHGKVVQPLHDQSVIRNQTTGSNEAVSLLRTKLDSLYGTEPDAKKEIAEAKAHTRPKSKHQQYMLELSGSGKSLAEIQTAWHRYYSELPDDQKHQVWQEFYADYNKTGNRDPHVHDQRSPKSKPHEPITHTTAQNTHPLDPREPSNIRNDLRQNISRKTRKPASPLKSLGFGFAMGMIVLVLSMFSFFNERFVTPFIAPSRTVSSSPIIIDPNTTAVDSSPKLIIPKINVEIPVVFDEPSIEEEAVQAALENGALHYATTAKPGEIGNGVIFGHSSNNLLNSGRFKFAFVLLNRLENGDTFMVQYEGKRYVYEIYKKHVVAPTEISVLDAQEEASTMTLITCDPPGSSLNRLVVVAKQISPDPIANIASTAIDAPAETAVLPSNAPTLWNRLTSWF